MSADYVAFLEDDDQWHPERTTVALRALANGDFTSTTQLELEESGSITRINDFPTPSGWFMPISSWQRVGPFNEAYRWLRAYFDAKARARGAANYPADTGGLLPP